MWQGHLSANQIGRQCRQSIVLVLRPAVFDRYILTLDVAGSPQPMVKCAQRGPRDSVVDDLGSRNPITGIASGCARAAERARRSRTAERGQQFLPSDGDCHTPLPREVRDGKRYHATSVQSSRSRGDRRVNLRVGAHLPTCCQSLPGRSQRCAARTGSVRWSDSSSVTTRALRTNSCSSSCGQAGPVALPAPHRAI